MEDYRSEFEENSEFVASISTEDADVVSEFESDEDYTANLSEANEFTLETSDDETFEAVFTETVGSGSSGDHNNLSGRQDADCHPMSSITNLNSTLEVMNSTVITRFTADENDIDALEAGNVVVRGRLTAAEGNIVSLQTETATITNRLTAAEADIDTLDANKLSATQADIDYARIDRTNINKAWVESLLVQGEIIAASGSIFYLDAVQVNATNITAGTLDVQRLIVTDSSTGEKYLVHFDSSGSAVREKLDGNIVEDLTITADKLVAGAVTTDKLAANSVTSLNILTGAITTDKIAANAVTATEIASNAITTHKIASNAITVDKIAVNAVTAEKISVTDLCSIGATIGSFHISTDAIWSGNVGWIFPDTVLYPADTLYPAAGGIGQMSANSVYIAPDGIALGTKFSVDANGNMTANDATLSGTFTTTQSGTTLTINNGTIHKTTNSLQADAQFRTTIWSQTRTESAWAARTLSVSGGDLSADPQSFDFLEFVCAIGASSGDMTIRVRVSGSTYLTALRGPNACYGSFMVLDRKVTVSQNQVVIGGARYKFEGSSSDNADNSYMIPYIIYGITT